MRHPILRLIPVCTLAGLMLATAVQAQTDAVKVYKANCELCHGPDGSGNTGPGKAFHAQDLRSNDTQKQSDAALTEVIAKGRGKMPAFGAKLKPDDITKLVAHLRTLAAKK
jgi:mono/diheme cytochrome c family protein